MAFFVGEGGAGGDEPALDEVLGVRIRQVLAEPHDFYPSLPCAEASVLKCFGEGGVWIEVFVKLVVECVWEVVV